MPDGPAKKLAKASPRIRAPVPVIRRHLSPVHGPAADVLHLRSMVLQPALKVGAANDPLEREAENTAERIVAMPAPAPADAGEEQNAPAEPDIATIRRGTIDDQPSTDAVETLPPVPADHQDPEVPGEEDVDTTGLTADDMNEIESGEPDDTSGEPAAEGPAGAPAADGAPGTEEESVAQPARDGAVVGAEGGAAPADVSGHVSQPGSGRPLPASVRAFMEPRFGHDFSDVRIHDTPDDRRVASRIGARAFTHRNRIWMGPGETVENRRLLAHELTHVVQQTKRKPATVSRAIDTTEDKGEPEVRRGYIRNKAEKYARKVPGYRLVSVILGKSPITGDRVERNATNLIGALLALIPGGGELFDRLMETRVIQQAFDWVAARLHSLNITWTRIKRLIGELIDYLPAWPSNAIRKAKQLFGPLLRDILTFVKEAVQKVLEFIIRGALKLAGPWGEKIWAVIQKAGSVIAKIIKDPLGFAKNLFKAVLQGFGQFRRRILEHIKKGLLGWLFGTIRGLNLEIPDKLDFKGLLSVGLQVIGLTYANFRKQLVDRLGKNGERKVAYLEKSVEVVKILVKEGFVGLWQRVLEMIDKFNETVIGGIRKFVIESLIMGGISWLAGLSNPVGAIIKVALAIYKMIKTFLERIDQIVQVANSIFSSIGAIAAGRVKQAADFIENALARTIPVIISFLAALVPISGITNAIRGIIKRLQTPVQNAMGKMITFLVKKAKKLFSKIISKLNKKRKLPSANFKVGQAQHRLYAEKKGKSVQVMVASGTGRPIEEVDQATREEAAKLKGAEAKKIGEGIAGEVTEADKDTNKVEKTIDLASKKDNQQKSMSKLATEIKGSALEIEQAAKPAADNLEVDTADGYSGPLYRFREPRDPKVEGQVGTYAEMRDIVKNTENETKRSGGSFYEVDHIVEKQIPKAILENLRKLDPSKSTRASMTLFRAKERGDKSDRKSVAEKETRTAANFGQIGTKAVSKIGDDAPQFPGIILYRPNHREKAVKHAEVLSWIQQASESDDPHAAMREKIQARLNEERDGVAKAYQQDKDASEAVSKNINEGLQAIQVKNAPFYDLDGSGDRKPLDASKKAADARSKSALSFDSTDPAHPDFDSIEARYDAFSGLESGFGNYLEKDHIVEKSYPIRAQGLTFASQPIWAQIAAVQPVSEEEPTKEQQKTIEHRRQQLRTQKVISGGPIAAYTGDSGKAMLMYRPIHRAVSAASPGARSDVDVVPDGAIPAIASAAQEFLATGDDGQIDKIRAAIKPGMRQKALAATEKHARKVEGEYDKEINNVKAANVDSGPDAAAQATAKMQIIVNTVKRNLSEARNYTRTLFS